MGGADGIVCVQGKSVISKFKGKACNLLEWRGEGGGVNIVWYLITGGIL